MSIEIEGLAKRNEELATAEPGSEPAIMVATREGTPVACTDVDRLYSMREAIRCVVGFFAGAWAPDDVAILNDPYTSGSDVGEFTLVRAGTESVIAVKARVPDIGGFQLGAVAPESFDVWGEGCRFPPIKVGAGGGWRRQALDLVALNSRTPAILRRRFGLMSNLSAALAEVADAALGSAAQPRALEPPLFESLTVGTHEAERLVEGPEGWPQPAVRVRLHVRPDRISVDTSHSDPQVALPLNSTAPHSGDCCLAAVATACPDIDMVALLEAFDLDPGPALVTSARLPATTSLSRFFTARAIRRAVTAALVKAGSQADEDSWWRDRGEPVFKALVDPKTLHLRDDVQQTWRALERAQTAAR